MTEPAPPTDTLELMPVLQRVRRRLGWIFLVGLLGAALAVTATYLLPPVHRARASVFIPPREVTVLGGVGLGEGGLAGAAAAVLGTGPSAVKVFRALLESESAVDYVRKETGLERRELLRKRRIEERPGESLLVLSVTDADPEKARRIVALHIEALERINREVNAFGPEDDRRVLQGALAEARGKLADAEAAFLAFQKRARTAPLPLSAAPSAGSAPPNWAQRLRELEVERDRLEASFREAQRRARRAAGTGGEIPSDIPPVVKFRPRLIDKELQVRAAEQVSGPDSPELLILRRELADLRSQMEKEIRAYLAAVQTEAIEPSAPESSIALFAQRVGVETQIEALRRLAAAAPGEVVELTRLSREVAIQSEIVRSLTTQLELARVLAAREPNRWVLLDEPWVEDRPVNKRYVFTAAAAGLLAVLAAVLVALGRPLPEERSPEG